MECYNVVHLPSRGGAPRPFCSNAAPATPSLAHANAAASSANTRRPQTAHTPARHIIIHHIHELVDGGQAWKPRFLVNVAGTDSVQ